MKILRQLVSISIIVAFMSLSLGKAAAAVDIQAGQHGAMQMVTETVPVAMHDCQHCQDGTGASCDLMLNHSGATFNHNQCHTSAGFFVYLPANHQLQASRLLLHHRSPYLFSSQIHISTPRLRPPITA